MTLGSPGVASLADGRIRRFFDAGFRQVIRNSTWSVATTAVTVGLFFVETTILARYFGPRTYGVYVLVIAYPETVQLLLAFRTREAMTKYLGGHLARNELPDAVAVVKLLWLVDLAVVCLAYGIVLATASLVAPHLTHNGGSPHLMRIYGLAMLFGGLDATAGAVIRVFDRFRLSFLTGGGSMVLRLALVVTALVTGSGLEGVIWARVVAEVLTTLIMGTAAFVLLKEALWEHRRTAIRRLSGRLGSISSFLLHTNFQGSLAALAGKLDVIVVGAMTGPLTAGYYKLGIQYGASPLLFSDPLFSSVYPQFAREHALGNDRQIRRLGLRTSITLAAVAGPTGLVLAIASKPLLTGILGHAFAHAWIPFVLALAGVVPAVVFFWGRAAMLSLGDARAASKVRALGTLVQFAVLLAFVKSFGAGGAAAGFAAMNIVIVALTIRYLRKRALL